MKLSKSIDQSRICKNSYDDPLGYFCMFFFFTCPSGQVTNKFHLSNGRFHLSRTIGQTLLSRPVLVITVVYFLKYFGNFHVFCASRTIWPLVDSYREYLRFVYLIMCFYYLIANCIMHLFIWMVQQISMCNNYRVYYYLIYIYIK
jgi:hypothetical protein